LTFTLLAEPVDGRQAFYIDATGQLVEIPEAALDRPGNFVFAAWLVDLQGGIATDPIAGVPSADEQFEVAPSGTQNVAAAFVGFRREGAIFPVVNAAVRWEIDRQFEGAVGSLQFGAADDGSNAPGADPGFISDDQADTFTNNGNVRNPSRFPISTTAPLHNVTGVATPDTNGFTWVTLFSPDPRATARLVVVASVNGTEIDKQRLIKNFAPVPELRISKTVEPSTVILPPGGEASVTFTVVVRNVGQGNATNVVHSDRLTAGPPGGYNIDVTTLPAGSRPVDEDEDGNVEGFNLTIAELPADRSETLTFNAVVRRDAEQYCNTIRITEFATEFETVTEDLPDPAEACFNVIRPQLEILKDFVNADGNELGNSVTVRRNEAARVRVRLINSGTAPATGVRLSDALTEGNADAYRLSNLPPNATPSGTTGFDLNIGRIAVGETVTRTFNARASVDGRYCDTASFVSTAAGTGEDDACLVVATPELTIVKRNAPTEDLLPGAPYRSTITVTNVGNTPVSDVVISDRLGLRNGTTTDFVEHVSSSLDGTAGTFDPGTNTVTFAAVNLAPDASVTATVTSRLRDNALPGAYCDIARYTSANAGNDNAPEACVNVTAFSAIQSTLDDDEDPVRTAALLNGLIFNENRSNEPLDNNVLVFTFGEGRFAIQRTRVFFDSAPRLDPNTGQVLSGPPDDGVELVEGTGYTRQPGGTGEETITLTAPLRPGEAVYTLHTVRTPAVTQPTPFTSTFRWTAVGRTSGIDHVSTPEEPTTVVP
jgi:hypothetical protein